jgi:arabinogalactan oligomer/maltooligosaccharide transport system permease protein
MNIPADLYESATIDGAGPVKSFTKITLPYMLFVTTPYLITTFIGNINNFNVIYLLTGGGPFTNPDYYNAGYTDILVTWLFNLTMGEKQDYKLAAAIGILVFIVCATLSLITFNMTKSAKDEEAFS